jgi:hypothetical protein
MAILYNTSLLTESQMTQLKFQWRPILAPTPQMFTWRYFIVRGHRINYINTYYENKINSHVNEILRN